ncbi:glycosyltransferase family 2 protein [Geodermatophilus sp. SYSU D01062]
MTATLPSADRTTPAGPVRVTVAVPTYLRPAHLGALLPVLVEQAAEVTAAGRYAVEVLVVDNDPDTGARPLVAAVGGVRYAAEPTPGIAAVRNRALDEAAGSQLLAFIDDDERPCERWLAALLATWETTGAAAVSGRVLADYAHEPGPFIRAGGFFVRRSLPTGTRIDLAATGNLLLDLDQVRRSGTRFEPALGLGGGEDTLFSRSLARAGAWLVWCDESAVVDQVPAERLTRRWVLTRAWSHGNSSVLTDLRLTSGPLPRLRVRLRGAARGGLRVAGGAARWALGVLVRSPRHRARGLRALYRGAGMLGGAAGLVYVEYARGGRRWRLARGAAA